MIYGFQFRKTNWTGNRANKSPLPHDMYVVGTWTTQQQLTGLMGPSCSPKSWLSHVKFYYLPITNVGTAKEKSMGWWSLKSSNLIVHSWPSKWNNPIWLDVIGSDFPISNGLLIFLGLCRPFHNDKWSAIISLCGKEIGHTTTRTRLMQ